MYGEWRIPIYIYIYFFVYSFQELHGHWSARKHGKKKTLQPSVGCDEARLAQRVQPRQQLKSHPNNHQCNAAVKTPTNQTDTQRSRYDNINQACNGSVCKKGGASGPSSRKLYKVRRGKSRTNQDEIANQKKRKPDYTKNDLQGKWTSSTTIKDYPRRMMRNHKGE